MPSRSEMDRPAMVLAAVLGVVLIAVSVPFIGKVSGSAAGSTYAIAWSQADAGSAQAPMGGAGAKTMVHVLVTDVLPSNATIELASCSDGAQPPVSSTATITWTLFAGDHAVAGGAGTASCASDGPFKVALHSHPDVGEAKAGSAEAAAHSAYTGNFTHDYRLEFSWSRPAAPGGLPLPGPAFSATMKLTISKWVAVANLPVEGGK